MKNPIDRFFGFSTIFIRRNDDASFNPQDRTDFEQASDHVLYIGNPATLMQVIQVIN
ncbi:hypothetical protein D3C71_1900070 [compost metagenome]